MEDLSPELSSLKEEIEESANVTEEVKDAVPTTEADSSTSAADMAGHAAGAMTKAKQAMEKLDEREDGITDEVEIGLDEMHQAPTDPVTPPEPAGESIDYSAVTSPEPETISAYSAEEVMAAQQNYELSNRVAQMVPAEYEEWMFPPMGHPGYHLGQLCLSRVIANLASAGYNSVTLDEDPVVYPRKVQIAASTWSQTHYTGDDLETTRRELTMAPASEVQVLIPATSTMIDDLVSSRYPPMDVEVETVMVEDKTTSPLVSMGVIAATGLTAMILPIYLVRRWTKL
jgi:hypothetical protein